MEQTMSVRVMSMGEGPVRMNLKPERVQQLLLRVPGWKLLAEGRGLETVRKFTSAGAASSFAAQACRLATLRRQPASALARIDPPLLGKSDPPFAVSIVVELSLQYDGPRLDSTPGVRGRVWRDNRWSWAMTALQGVRRAVRGGPAGGGRRQRAVVFAAGQNHLCAPKRTQLTRRPGRD